MECSVISWIIGISISFTDTPTDLVVKNCIGENKPRVYEMETEREVSIVDVINTTDGERLYIYKLKG